MKTLAQKQTIHDRSSSVRLKTMDWMRLPEYDWWLAHTDCMPCQTPKFCWKFRFFLCEYMLAFGFSLIDNKHTGPPSSD